MVGQLTEVVGPTNVIINTNNTYATEYEGFAVGYDSAADAWDSVTSIYSSNSTNYPSKIFDNVGWVKGTKEAYGDWGGYLWLLQNIVNFESSPTNIWVSPDGVTNHIAKVLVGSIGDYPPMTNVVDIGPTNWNGDAITNYLGEGLSTDLVCRADFTAYYQLIPVRVDIAMDGNRDDTIDFDDPDDRKYLFWVNDDHDQRHYLQTELIWVEDDLDGDPDCNNDYIGNNTELGENSCKRDLEDFTRLHIQVDDTMANLPSITYYLKFENGTDGPSVNIFEAVGESSAYLSDVNVADAQIEKTKLLTVESAEI